MKILLTLIIPVYNRQDSFDLLLEELSRQTFENGFQNIIELIVIDDFSLNSIVLSESAFSQKLLLRNESNLGAPYSRKKAFAHSSGKFIHFHDSDDSISDNWLVEVIKELKLIPDLDLLVTGRKEHENDSISLKSPKFFQRNVSSPKKIRNWLAYQNCIGPLGGVTFSRRVLEETRFLNLASCQDWQMYIDAMKHAKVLRSRPDIHFIFNCGSGDRISKNPRKKILGHLQLAKVTSEMTIFKKNIRLFYIYACRGYILERSGFILNYYNKNKVKISSVYQFMNTYWRLTRHANSK